MSTYMLKCLFYTPSRFDPPDRMVKYCVGRGRGGGGRFHVHTKCIDADRLLATLHANQIFLIREEDLHAIGKPCTCIDTQAHMDIVDRCQELFFTNC